MKFSISMIVYNESKNITKLAESAKKYIDAGGKIYVLDTGSTDDTVEVAQKLGFMVTRATTRFYDILTKKMLRVWKNKYGIIKDPVKAPVEFFCFDKARNEAAKLSNESITFFMDGCDKFINFDYDAINKLIENGFDSFCTKQLYSGAVGNINRFYNKTRTRNFHPKLK